MILIDIGSSTVKAYLFKNSNLKLISSKSISFKKNFDEANGISLASKKQLYEFIEKTKASFPNMIIKAFATSVFRKITKETRRKFVDEFFEKTKCYLNIISQDLENRYLQAALVGKYKGSKPILLINIGGGSVELAMARKQKIIEEKNLDFGVVSVIRNFPQINKNYSKSDLEDVVEFIKSRLTDIENTASAAIYSGGELTYMKLTGYKLKRNTVFSDKDHPALLEFPDFVKRNSEIYDKVSLSELKDLMPENPSWMHGARACSAIAQAICEKYKVKKIIPSDSNLVDGVVRQEFRNVTLSGSFRKHLRYIFLVRKKLNKLGVKVLSPEFTIPTNPNDEFVVFEGEEGRSPLELERHHLNSIEKSDALVVCDPKGYVGAFAMIEIGYANALGKRVIFTEKPSEFMLNTLPHEVGL